MVSPALVASQDMHANAHTFMEDLLINGAELRIPVPADVEWSAGVRRIAELARQAGGFITFRASPLIRSRIQFTGIDDVYNARLQVLRLRNELIGLANTMNPMLVALGGGCKDIAVHARQSRQLGACLEVDLIVEVPDRSEGRVLDMLIARMAPLIEQLTHGTRNRTSISDIADRQLLCAQVALDGHCFALAPQQADAMAARIVDLHRHICTTPGRMALHNAGIVAVVNSMLATSTPAGALHNSVWTAQSDPDAPLCIWYRDHRGRLCGRIALPLITALVEHDMSATTGVSGILEAKHAIAAIGLAHSLASLHADAGTATHNQAGLHAHDLALLAGARGDEITTLARSLHNAGQIRCEYAIDLLDVLRRQ